MDDLDKSKLDWESIHGWMEKSEIEKVLAIGVTGELELGKEEKLHYLGEFQERVILNLTLKDVFKPEGRLKVKEALRDPRAKAIILNGKVPLEMVSLYIKLAKEYGRTCTVRHNPEFKGNNALVVVSDQAIR